MSPYVKWFIYVKYRSNETKLQYVKIDNSLGGGMMAIKGTREWDKSQTQKDFLSAIDRLISGKVKNKKDLKTFKRSMTLMSAKRQGVKMVP